MLIIRLQRIGKKNQPCFDIIVTDKKNSPRGGRRVERLGFYNPLTKETSLKKERVLYWISKGAKCSDTLHNLLIKQKVLEGKKIAVHKKSKKKTEAKPSIPGQVPAAVPSTPEKPPEQKPAEPKPEEKPKLPEGKKEEPK